MKCSVCDTKIPLGQTICPNCGKEMKTEVSLVNVENETNQSKTISKKNRSYDSLIFTAKIIMLTLIGILMTVVMTKVAHKIINNSFNITTISDLSKMEGYEEIADSLYNIKEEMFDIFMTYFNEIEVDESVYIEDEVTSYIELYSEKENLLYVLGYMCIDDQPYHRIFDIVWRDTSIDLDISFPYGKDIAEGIAKDLGYDISMEEVNDLYKKFLSDVKKELDNGSEENEFIETVKFDGWKTDLVLTKQGRVYDFEIIVKFYEE